MAKTDPNVRFGLMVGSMLGFYAGWLIGSGTGGTLVWGDEMREVTLPGGTSRDRTVYVKDLTHDGEDRLYAHCRLAD